MFAFWRKSKHFDFLQLALLGIPAQIIHGNSLTAESFAVWNTPFLYLNHSIINNEFHSAPASGTEIAEETEITTEKIKPPVVKVHAEKYSANEQLSLFDEALFYKNSEDEEDLEV